MLVLQRKTTDLAGTCCGSSLASNHTSCGGTRILRCSTRWCGRGPQQCGPYPDLAIFVSVVSPQLNTLWTFYTQANFSTAYTNNMDSYVDTDLDRLIAPTRDNISITWNSDIFRQQHATECTR